MSAPEGPIVEVVTDTPLFGVFDYLVSGDSAEPGARVSVPFGKKNVVGIVVGSKSASELPPDKLKPIKATLDWAIPKELLDLARFAAHYYAYPLGAALFTALPLAFKTTRALPKPMELGLSMKGRDVLKVNECGAPRQRALLGALGRAPHALDRPELLRLDGYDARVLARLLERGWAQRVPAQRRALDVTEGPTLTSAQQAALEIAARDATSFSPTLIQGVTGSGKTEVYLRLVEATLRKGAQALLLVPEINLTPQLEAAVRQRFPRSRIVVLHSKRSEGERLTGWQLAAVGVADIVIGTRLAVFTPMPGLGLIIVDEEHDSSFKQQEGFRYSARDLALVRAQRRKIPVVLGSATPSLETFHNVRRGKIQLATMMTRAVAGAAMPTITTIDIRREPTVDGLSAPLNTALAQTLSRGEQSLVFLNRRGYAPVLYCRSCGAIPECSQCSSRLVVHLRDHRLLCHYCGMRTPIAARCRSCGSADLEALGEGTQRIETALSIYLPQARVMRFDRDSTQRKHAARELLARVHSNQVDILVGTQMLAKGHDFPRVTLVAVPDVDGALFSSDFRAPERLFALLTQVAGRAGRHGAGGRVLIQTRAPDHPLFTALKSADYADFSERLLAERLAAGFPPFVHQALLRAEARKETDAVGFLQQAKDLVPPLAKIDVFDPVPATIARIAGKTRLQLLTQSRSRPALQRMLADWVHALSALKSPGVKWSVDVDPQEF